MSESMSHKFYIVPITLRAANAFVQEHHRHNKPVRGWKFGVGLRDDNGLVGVAIASRPIARALDDGRTIEITRTCTNGARNANSMLYGAVWRAARAMGYTRAITYTRQVESGASLRAANFRIAAVLDPRGSWAESSKKLRHLRDEDAESGVARIRWEIKVENND